MKVIKFSYTQDYETSIMFSDIVKSAGISSDKAPSVYQFEINKYLLMNWVTKIESEDKFPHLIPEIIKIAHAENSASIYSYFEGPEKVFQEPEHYDHFLGSVIESILRLMEALNLTFTSNVLSKNFTQQQINREEDARTNLDTEQLGDILLNSHRGLKSFEESKDSPLHRTTQLDFQKQMLRNIITSKVELD